ncbi:2,3-bisphosphoglycerate-dependent phosphoglycerate mutase [Anatilimnocola aggregata]|uniref:2,3-bisphosphoglycerate-dependent phosphoglycerate mutase n=1 Tax=Anatilimnocola aggregata TaxID=2528021 RepID=A0A517YER3_9BACT|nr:histidine phosphatase family protein [Anatilimnocola aggregata]QDU28735.1 2,3-bisphosphoglycerate-dependent phosphoglycerate mutase [Anatilimnocola aggregata]
MKTLLLLRHAKSSWKDSDLDDHDRPLNKRGKRDAPRMGKLLLDENLLPNLIVCSSAKRTRRTAELVAEASGYREETRITGDLYEAWADRLLAIINALPAEAARVLLVGHNPGLEELLESVTGNYRPLSTASLAWLEYPVEHWREITRETRAELKQLWQPRELE